MKKKIYVVALALLAAVCAFVMAACAAADGSKLFKPYDRGVEDENSVYSDANATVDGDLSEDIWKNASWHDMKSTVDNRVGGNAVVRIDDCDFKATLVPSEKGMYFAAESNDKIIYVGEQFGVTGLPLLQRSAFAQTGITVLFIDYAELFSGGGIYEVGFGLDGAVACHYHKDGSMYDLQLDGVKTGVKIDGSINSTGNNGYSMEAFIPWASLEKLNAERPPASVMATFASQRYDGVNSDSLLCWEMLDGGKGAGWLAPVTWEQYGANGFMTLSQGEIFGNYGDAVYDRGYDLTNDAAADKKVTFTATSRRHAEVYVKDTADSELYAEAHFTLGESNSVGEVDQWPMVGVVFHGKEKTVSAGAEYTQSMYVGLGTDLKTDPLVVTPFTSDPLNGADFAGSRRYNTHLGEVNFRDFKLGVYRGGDTFYVFINDEFNCTAKAEYMPDGNDSYMGLFIRNISAVVDNYSFLSGEQARTKLGLLLDETAGATFGIKDFGGNYQNGVNVSNDKGDNATVEIKVPANGQRYAAVNSWAGDSNKFFAEFNVKYMGTVTANPTGVVAMAFINADGNVSYYGIVLNGGKYTHVASWWTAERNLIMYPLSGSDANWMTNEDFGFVAGSTEKDEKIRSEGIKLTVYSDGETYYFFADGKPVNNYTGMNTRKTAGDNFNVGASEIVTMGLAVENAHVEYYGYTLLSGDAADEAFKQYSQGATFGNYKTNKATGGVYYGNDLGTEESSVKISRKVPGFSRTYARDICDTVLWAEATITVNVQAVGWATLGLEFITEDNAAAMYAGVGLQNNTEILYNTVYMGFKNDVSNPDAVGYLQLSGIVPAEGVRFAVYRSGGEFHFFLNGQLAATKTDALIGETAKTYIALYAQHCTVTASDYTFLTGQKATEKYNAYGLQTAGATFGIKDFGGNYQNGVNVSNDKGDNATVEIKVPANGQRYAAVNSWAGDSNKFFAEFNVKYMGTVTANPTGVVAMAFINADGNVSYYGIVLNGGKYTHVASWWTAERNLIMYPLSGSDANWMTNEDFGFVAGSTEKDEKIRSEGIKLTVYSDGETYYFFADGKPVNNYTGMNTRKTAGDNFNVGASEIVTMGLAVENAHVEYYGYTLLSGDAADEAFKQYSQGATFGNYKTNKATGGVYYGNDLGTEESSVKISRKVPGFSRTYARDICDTVLWAEATITVNVQAVGWATLGLEFITEDNAAAMYAGVGLQNNTEILYNTVYMGFKNDVSNPDAVGYLQLSGIVPAEGVRFAVYRSGGEFHFFLNGQLAATKTDALIGETAKTYIALYAQHCTVTASGYRFLSGEAATAAYEAYTAAQEA